MDVKTIGALIFMVLIVGANLFMYGLLRAWTKPGKKDILQTLGDSFNASRKKENDMDELRRRLEELEKSKPEQKTDSKTS